MNKILIIDDDRELCALIKRSVQAENIEADFCNTGKEGLQKLREQEYHPFSTGFKIHMIGMSYGNKFFNDLSLNI